MSLFTELEQNGLVYEYVDNSTTKNNSRRPSPSFSININIIRLNELDSIVLQSQELGEYRAHVAGTNGCNLKKGMIVRVEDSFYQVVTKPKKQKLFNKYKVNLKPVDGRNNEL